MKKFFAIIAIIATMMISFSCRQEKNVETEEVTVEEVDSTELYDVPLPDTLVVE